MTPSGKGGASSRLTFFGEWIIAICEFFAVEEATLADRAGIGRETLSHLKLISQPSGREKRPKAETVEKLWKAIQDMMREHHGFTLSAEFEEGFRNAAGHISAAQHEQSRMRLDMLQAGRTLTSQLIIQQHEIEELRSRIHELEASQRRRRQ